MSFEFEKNFSNKCKNGYCIVLLILCDLFETLNIIKNDVAQAF